MEQKFVSKDNLDQFGTRIKNKLAAVVEDRLFVFECDTGLDTWRIEHGLNKVPEVTVIENGNEDGVTECHVEIIDLKTLVITFPGGINGKAFIY